jgi:hypothetical protein
VWAIGQAEIEPGEIGQERPGALVLGLDQREQRGVGRLGERGVGAGDVEVGADERQLGVAG